MSQSFAHWKSASDLAKRGSSTRSRGLTTWSVIMLLTAYLPGSGTSVEAGEAGVVQGSSSRPILLAVRFRRVGSPR